MTLHIISSRPFKEGDRVRRTNWPGPHPPEGSVWDTGRVESDGEIAIEWDSPDEPCWVPVRKVELIR